VGQVRELQAVFPPQGAFPNGHNAPALGSQLEQVLLVVFGVPGYLASPELRIGFGPLEEMALVPMPETPVNENNGPVLREDKVGASGQVALVQPVAKSERM